MLVVSLLVYSRSLQVPKRFGKGEGIYRSLSVVEGQRIFLKLRTALKDEVGTISVTLDSPELVALGGKVRCKCKV